MDNNEQKFASLSSIVSKRAKKTIKRIIITISAIATIIIVCILVNNANNTCIENAKLYTSQVETSVTEKISFIETIASGVNSGAVTKDSYYEYVDEMVAQYDDVSAEIGRASCRERV